jgi:hypothetical protein
MVSASLSLLTTMVQGRTALMVATILSERCLHKHYHHQLCRHANV